MAASNTGFGPLARDGHGGSLQTATKFGTQDASDPPKTSPLPYTSVIITLVMPADAVQLILAPTTDLRVSDDPAMGRYDLVTAGSKEAFPVALLTNVYLRRNTIDGAVHFRFARV